MTSINLFAIAQTDFSEFFKDVTWGQIIATAVIATVLSIATTLIIEYFAKPKLEARKARLMRDRAQYDKIVFDFQRISAALGALPSEQNANKSRIFERFQKIMLNEAREGLYDLMRDMSKLSTKYAVNHDKHIAKTMRFIGYLLSQVELAAEGKRSINIDELRSTANNLELFDVYYVVYVYMYDSQEGWWRRIFWRIRKEKKNDQKIDKLFDSLGFEGGI